MRAKILINKGSFTLELDYYRKQWTSFLKSKGGVFSDGVWFLQIKHLEPIKKKLDKIRFKYDIKEMEQPVRKIDIMFDKMKLPPRDYQKVASTLMANSHAFGLFDDCGLGKTISAISAIIGIGAKKSLIIAEIKALSQWTSEIERFTGAKSCVVRGNPEEREEMWKQDHKIFITNYHLMLKDFKSMDKDWDIIVFDEASRYLRNRNAKLSACARALKSKHKWALTGSPIENNLVDVFSLYEIMDETILGNWESFKRNHVRIRQKVVNKYWNGREWVYKKIEIIVGYKNQEIVKRNISPYFIRRTDTDVKGELPDIIYQDIKIPLSEKQQEIYDEIENSIHEMSKDSNVKIMSLGELTHLRRVCDSSKLIRLEEEDESSKFDEIEKMIYENRHRKVIIFSQWVEPLLLLSKRISGYSVIVGSASKSKFGNLKDEDELKKFRQGSNNILLSSDAGSRSLNLQVASMIINLDLPWNPQVLVQRGGRIRRMDSKHKSVVIYNLISKDTIEEKITPLLKAKIQTSEDFIDNNVYNQYKNMNVEEFLRREFK